MTEKAPESDWTHEDGVAARKAVIARIFEQFDGTQPNRAIGFMTGELPGRNRIIQCLTGRVGSISDSTPTSLHLAVFHIDSSFVQYAPNERYQQLDVQVWDENDPRFSRLGRYNVTNRNILDTVNPQTTAQDHELLDYLDQARFDDTADAVLAGFIENFSKRG